MTVENEVLRGKIETLEGVAAKEEEKEGMKKKTEELWTENEGMKKKLEELWTENEGMKKKTGIMDRK